MHRDSCSKDFPEWDSMGTLAILTVLSRQGVQIDPGSVDMLQSIHGIIGQVRDAGRLD
jgi:hypothetical protein